jgi:hypothetical protein
MEILRLASSIPQAIIEVPDANTEYSCQILDLSDGTTTSLEITSNSDSQVIVPFSKEYDGEYRVRVEQEEHFFTVVRPYVDPSTLSSNFSEVSEYTKHEEIARAIIDSIVIEGFYYKKRVIDTVGLGADYIPLWTNVQKINKLYENNVLLYNVEDLENSAMKYKLTDDKTAITIDYQDQINRSEGADVLIPLAPSDLWDTKFGYRGFAKTFDYSLHLEVGYKRVPSDIVRAATLLIDDIKCNRLDYAGRYIIDYNTDQFKIKFDDRVFEGTGNMIVDKILSKYAKSIRILGVL